MHVFTAGRRAFTAAAVLMLLTALAHTLGSIQPIRDAEQRLLITQMAALRLPVGMGMMPSVWDIYQDLTFTMSITFLGLGLVNLALASSKLVPAPVLRRISWMNLVWVSAFTVLSAVFQIFPAVASGVLIVIMILAALI